MAVIAPMEATHEAAQQGRLDLKRVRADCAKSSRLHHQSLAESIELQKHLRQLTHRVLVAQEAERVKLSHELQDEIAQTLLGINVRLLALKKGARSGTAGLQNEITRTQRLILKSARSVRRFARELGLPAPA
jgi:signal transduction histidine kinase